MRDKMVLMKKLHRIIDERGEKLLPLPSGWHKYGYYNRIWNHFNCDGLDADARPLLTSQDWDFYKKTSWTSTLQGSNLQGLVHR